MEPHPAPILTLSTLYPNAAEPGLGIFVRARVRSLARAGVDLRVVAPVGVLDFSSPDGRLWRSDIGYRESPDGFEVLHPRWLYPPRFGGINPLLLAARLWPLVASIRRRIPFRLLDAQFGYPDGPAAALLARLLGIPFTMTLRGSEVLHGEFPVRRRWLRFAFRRAARVFPVSERLREFAIAHGAEPDRVKTVPNGVDGALFHPRDEQQCRMQHRLPLGVPLILTAGHLIELKGHHRAVAALGLLHDRGIQAHLVIAGGPGRVENYEHQIRHEIARRKLEKFVYMPGAVAPEVLGELMCAASVFCLASSREGWPNVVSEALACGTPVVAADAGAIPEMIPSAEYGLIARSCQPEELAPSLARALDEIRWNRDSIAAFGNRRTWPMVAAELLEQMPQSG